ncbi:MAG: RNA polymerase sigma factor [Planctomycetes bacterium]|nr:RNA polymerase sigma factor [Planctomycetota bacterium]
MSTLSLQDLLDKLCSGDPVSAEAVFREYEPYLRKVVRRLLPHWLRSKFDSIDIVQSAWSDVLQGFRNAGWRFESPGQLRAFLVKVTRNRFLDRYRQLKRVGENEEPLSGPILSALPASGEPSPSQLVQADDLWQKMLSACKQEHRSILLLKRQGASMSEIVAQTGLHPGSIRRILRQLAGQVALSQNAT